MRTVKLCSVFVAGLLLGCGKDEGTNTTNDPWARFPPENFIVAEDATKLPPDQFALVVHNESDALARLATKPWVRVTPEEAKAYTGRSLGGQGGEMVLVRALALNERNGAFDVTWRAGEVRVSHGCLGHRPVPQVRRGIVARLPGLPTEVYVDCSMAE